MHKLKMVAALAILLVPALVRAGGVPQVKRL